MHWLDIVLLVILGVSALAGLTQGLIKAALSLAGIIVGVILAGNFYEQLAGLLAFIPNEDIANFAAFILILVGVMVIANILARLLKFAVSVVLLGWVNRLGGAAFGLVLGAIFLSAILATWAKFFGGDSAAETVIASFLLESVIASFLLDKFPLILALLPAEFDAIGDFFQ